LVVTLVVISMALILLVKLGLVEVVMLVEAVAARGRVGITALAGAVQGQAGLVVVAASVNSAVPVEMAVVVVAVAATAVGLVEARTTSLMALGLLVPGGAGEEDTLIPAAVVVAVAAAALGQTETLLLEFMVVHTEVVAVVHVASVPVGMELMAL
jgi:hypothetical protein